ncbi:hypothetical protein [Chloroflexus aggregans]|uniref:Uncharacterized protein n=1 Tax=Chloroflexus aggregans (strain MD-66 / DSM 9485) TaxID=326427 RepID=B8G6Y7_CHLAD|nr:hypothetical protein [Chloroflexus aggregans]ACL25946.1 conserved hypothetical protein [Chloroflexus aggregans DSM 9485]
MRHQYRWILLAGVVVALSGCLSTLPTTVDVNGPLPATLPPLAQTLRATIVPTDFPSAHRIPTPSTSSPTSAAIIVATPAPEPPTPTLLPIPTLTLPTLPLLSNEERWRLQQLDRQVFPELRLYTTKRSELYWYDPVNEQEVLIGVINGEFMAQARFTFRKDNRLALEVPYHLNQSYGLSALSPALVERIHAAGYSDWIETFVYITPDIQPQP